MQHRIKYLQFHFSFARSWVNILHILQLRLITLLTFTSILFSRFSTSQSQLALYFALFGLYFFNTCSSIREWVVIFILLGWQIFFFVLRVFRILVIMLNIFIVAVYFLSFAFGIRPSMSLRKTSIFRHKSYKSYRLYTDYK
jgi:hypothetical protein